MLFAEELELDGLGIGFACGKSFLGWHVEQKVKSQACGEVEGVIIASKQIVEIPSFVKQCEECETLVALPTKYF